MENTEISLKEELSQEESQNSKEKFIYYSRKFFASTAIIVLIFFQVSLLGKNDFLSTLITLLTAIFIFFMTSKIYQSNRELLGVYAKKNSFLEEFIDRKNTILQVFVCIILSIFLSVLFVITTKGIVIKQNSYLSLLIPLFIFNILLYKFIKKDIPTPSSMMEENIHERVARHGLLLVKILAPALLLNFILSIWFSAYDTYTFKTANINLENFVKYTANSKDAIVSNGSNEYSKIFINAYLLMDNFKMAFTKYVTENMIKIDGYHIFFFISMLLNFIKLMFFSWTYVLLFHGFNIFHISLKKYCKNLVLRKIKTRKQKNEEIKTKRLWSYRNHHFNSRYFGHSWRILDCI